MSKKKLLSKDIEKMENSFKKMTEAWGVSNSEHALRIDKYLSDMRISALIEEEFIKNGEPYDLVPRDVTIYPDFID